MEIESLSVEIFAGVACAGIEDAEVVIEFILSRAHKVKHGLASSHLRN